MFSLALYILLFVAGLFVGTAAYRYLKMGYNRFFNRNFI